jgi:hypothetical protein
MADAQNSGVSRRTAILAGAGLVAVGATGGALTAKLAGGGTLSAATENPKVPMMVHLRDAPSGQFDVFFGETKVTIVDTDFAAKLVKAAAQAA